MTNGSGTMWDEIDAALDQAIQEAGLSNSQYGQRIKQLLDNRLNSQYREEDLVDLLEDMPISVANEVK